MYCYKHEIRICSRMCSTEVALKYGSVSHSNCSVQFTIPSYRPEMIMCVFLFFLCLQVCTYKAVADGDISTLYSHRPKLNSRGHKCWDEVKVFFLPLETFLWKAMWVTKTGLHTSGFQEKEIQTVTQTLVLGMHACLSIISWRISLFLVLFEKLFKSHEPHIWAIAYNWAFLHWAVAGWISWDNNLCVLKNNI